MRLTWLHGAETTPRVPATSSSQRLEQWRIPSAQFPSQPLSLLASGCLQRGARVGSIGAVLRDFQDGGFDQHILQHSIRIEVTGGFRRTNAEDRSCVVLSGISRAFTVTAILWPHYFQAPPSQLESQQS